MREPKRTDLSVVWFPHGTLGFDVPEPREGRETAAPANLGARSNPDATAGPGLHSDQRAWAVAHPKPACLLRVREALRELAPR